MHLRPTWPLLIACLLGVMLPHSMKAQQFYGVSATSDSLWSMNTTSWTVVQRRRLTLPGDSILRCQAMAYDPIGHQTYVVVRTQSQPNSSLLSTVVPSTGAVNAIGGLGDDFRAITFRADGQLLGVVGDSGIHPSTLHLIDKGTAATTLATALGNGDAGEALAFNSADGQLYHWSGNANPICERMPSSSPFTPISPIPLGGSPAQEVSAAQHQGGSDFLLAHTDSSISFQSAGGIRGPSLVNAPAVFSGMAMPPMFTLADASICLSEPVQVLFSGWATDTVVYDWGDSSFTSVFPPGPASHIYPFNAYFTIKVALKNSVSGADTVAALVVWVIHLPPVAISPGNDTMICDVDTVLLTGAFGGTSQWFRNGIPIPGANAFQHIATQNGWYNMTKTNQLGCTDSANVGVGIGFGSMDTPVITLDTSNCPTIAFTAASPLVSAWQWTFGDGSSSTAAQPSHTYGSVGSYPVQLTVTNACGTASSAAMAVVDCPIGVGESKVVDLNVFPNPGRGDFRVTVSGQGGKPLSIAVRDLNGTLLFHEILRGPVVDFPLHLGGPAGMYLLELEAGNRVLRRLLVLE